MSDKDKNGMLEMSEVQSDEPNIFRQSFTVFDYNSDEKLTKDECTTWYEHYQAAYTTRLAFGAADHGVQLFALLDTNEDQRIAGREIRNGIEWLKRWDVDGDSGVAVEELPTRYMLTFGQGQAAPIGNVNGVFIAGGSNIQPAERSKEGPLWFRRMDRNRDGDLSRGEFLGPMADFDRLDRDSDGLVDAAEAAEL
jgi:Ca2+-binding EF-hand superfamily protein